MDSQEDRAHFHDMSQSTQEDWQIIMRHNIPFSQNGGRRILDHLKLLDGDFGGFAVDRLTHSLQTATRAYRDA
jgi:predicted HD phosphohydrolase